MALLSNLIILMVYVCDADIMLYEHTEQEVEYKFMEPKTYISCSEVRYILLNIDLKLYCQVLERTKAIAVGMK